MLTTPVSEKDQMRRDIRSARQAFVRSLSPEERAAMEAAIAERAAPYFVNADAVAAYVPAGNEVDPAACLAAIPAGSLTLLPWFADQTAPMRFHDASGMLVPGPFGAQPLASAPEVMPDVLLIPLVVADAAGNRIGQGKGHFDRALTELRTKSPSIIAIGLAWDVQIVDAIPADAWDQRLDIVITPTRTFAA